MIRKYEHDFSEHGKKEVETQVRSKKLLKVIIVFSSIILALSIPFFFLPIKVVESELSFVLNILLAPYCFVPAGFSIAVFVLSIVALSKNKSGKLAVPFKILGLVLAIALFLSAIVTGVTCYIYLFMLMAGDAVVVVGIYETGRIIFLVVAIMNLLNAIGVIVIKSFYISTIGYYGGAKCVEYQSKYIGKFYSVKPLLANNDFATAIKTANKIQDEYIVVRKKEIAEAKAFLSEMKLEDKSTFDGNGIQLILWKLLGSIVTLFTLGILYPVKVAWVEGWKINHRKINGKQLHFDGNGFQLLGKYILWWLLCIVTFGIYLIVLPKKIEQWVTSHTYFVDLDHTDVRTKKLYMDHGVTKESKFEGKVIKLFFMKLGANLLALLTLGILLPAKICVVHRWRVNGQNINGLRMKFNGNAVQLLGKYILWWLLSIVTLGIYALFIPVRIEKWITKHSHFKAAYFDEGI